MATYSKEKLESEVIELNEWIQHHHEGHHLYEVKTKRRNFLVGKLVEMDEYNQEKIWIQA